MRSSSEWSRIAGLATFVVLQVVAVGQCQPEWAEGSPFPGSDGPIAASAMWDPDGAGPLVARPVIGGTFHQVVATACEGIAARDPATGIWSPLGSGAPLDVRAIAALPSGELVVGGRAVGDPEMVRRWNGSQWLHMGNELVSSPGPVFATVNALLVLPNGHLVAGGAFFGSTTTMAGVAEWTGTAWQPFGGVANPFGMFAEVKALTLLANGDLVAAGSFSVASGAPGEGIARWNGSAWVAMGAGLNGPVLALAAAPNGTLYAGGSFAASGTTVARNLAQWNGSAWSEVGGGVAGNVFPGVRALDFVGGNLLVGGVFDHVGGLAAGSFAVWSGATWLAAPGVSGTVNAMTSLPNGEALVAGSFGVGVAGAQNVATWNGATWSAIGAGTDRYVDVSVTLPDGDLVVGGRFEFVDGVHCPRLARRTANGWASLGSEFATGRVAALAVSPSGELYAAGTILSLAQVQVCHVARYDGAVWTSLDAGTFTNAANPTSLAVIDALAVLANGDLIAGGSFTHNGATALADIARWNGTSWLPLGLGITRTGGVLGSGLALQPLPNGDLIVGGDLATAGGAPVNYIARWNGAAWSPLGAGATSPILAMALLPNGDLVTGGVSFVGNPRDAVSRWSGGVWSAIGNGPLDTGYGTVAAIAVLPNGDLVVGGQGIVAPGSPNRRALLRWNGVAWAPLGADAPYVSTLAWLQDGGLFAGGLGFAPPTGNGLVGGYHAILRSPCPAAAVTVGPGCSGAGGPDVLTATALPWIGGAYRAHATGLPNTAVSLAVTSLLPAVVPLSLVFPGADPACQGLANILLSELVAPAAGSASMQLNVPNTSALVGIALWNQLVTLEFDAAGHWLDLTGSNRLQLTIGSF